jgi:glucuronate isomerase
MKKSFIHPEFMLDTKTASKLYHTYAESLPIIDYHCHIPPRDVAEDRQFENLTRIWLAGDHYKWRAMRASGIDEYYITGQASDWEKFEMWAMTVPKMIRNPLYHWTHLELNRPFGINNMLLSEKTAKAVWEKCNVKLSTKDFTAQGILKKMNVEIVCTTDDPIDSLEFHQSYAKLKNKTASTKLVPAWRPDKAMAAEDADSFNVYIGKLEAAANYEIKDFASLIQALRIRHAYFHDHGCRLSDHGIETAYADDYTESEVVNIFKRVRRGKMLDAEEIGKFKSAMMYEFGVMDYEKGWVQQLHLGALRNTNSRMRRVLGPDTGYDSIGDFEVARPLSKYLDRLDAGDKLAKTILYNLNPRDNELMASMIGNFQDGKSPGKIQYGSSWWFLDQKDGMTKQIEALSDLGVLSQFIGMLTDSRSFLSYPRHEYFRRILCRILGSEMEQGLIPNDLSHVGAIAANICYHNAKRYFPFASEE